MQWTQQGDRIACSGCGEDWGASSEVGCRCVPEAESARANKPTAASRLLERWVVTELSRLLESARGANTKFALEAVKEQRQLLCAIYDAMRDRVAESEVSALERRLEELKAEIHTARGGAARN